MMTAMYSRIYHVTKIEDGKKILREGFHGESVKAWRSFGDAVSWLFLSSREGMDCILELLVPYQAIHKLRGLPYVTVPSRRVVGVNMIKDI